MKKILLIVTCFFILIACNKTKKDENLLEDNIKIQISKIESSIDYNNKSIRLLEEKSNNSLTQIELDNYVAFLDSAIFYANQVDLSILNSVKPEYGDNYRNKYIKSLELRRFGMLNQDAIKMIEGQKLYDELEKRLKKMKIVQIVSVINGENEKSIKFHQKNDFIKIGCFTDAAYKLEKWHDILWMVKKINSLEII